MIQGHIGLPQLHVVVEHLVEPPLLLGLIAEDHIEGLQVQLEDGIVAQQRVQGAQQGAVAVQLQQGHVLDHIVLVLQLALRPTLHRGIGAGRAYLAEMLGKPRREVIVQIQFREAVEAFALDALFDHLVVLATVHEHLIQRVARGVRVDVVGAERVHELHCRRQVAHLELLHPCPHICLEGLIDWYFALQFSRLSKAHHTHQHIRVVTLYEGRIDTQFLGRIRGEPAARERLPRLVQAIYGKVPEVGLEQLATILAEFHVEIAVEYARRGVLLAVRQGTYVL